MGFSTAPARDAADDELHRWRTTTTATAIRSATAASDATMAAVAPSF
jgi:hypothetical protein